MAVMAKGKIGTSEDQKIIIAFVSEKANWMDEQQLNPLWHSKSAQQRCREKKKWRGWECEAISVDYWHDVPLRLLMRCSRPLVLSERGTAMER